MTVKCWFFCRIRITYTSEAPICSTSIETYSYISPADKIAMGHLDRPHMHVLLLCTGRVPAGRCFQLRHPLHAVLRHHHLRQCPVADAKAVSKEKICPVCRQHH